MGLLGWTFFKKKDKHTLFISLLSNISFAYLFEYLVLNLFQGYHYKPRFLKNPRLDNIFGAVLSQAIYVPSTSLFLTAFRANWGIRMIFVIYFVTIEYIFIKLKIYKTKWWSPFFTFIGIPIHFFLSDLWYKYLKKGTPLVLSISLFNMIVVTSSNILFLLAVLRKFKFGIGSYHTWYEHFVITPLYSILFSVVATSTLKVGDWSSKVKVFLFALLLDTIARKNNILNKNSLVMIVAHICVIYASSI